MDKKLKRITDANFKANSELKEQFIFKDGFCYFRKSEAENRKATIKENYITVKRDSKADQDEKDSAEKLAALKKDLEEHRALLLDVTEEAEKAELEKTIEELQGQIYQLEN